MSDPDRRPPEPLSPVSVTGLVVLVLGLAAWPLSGYWQAALIGLTLCVVTLVIEAARLQRRRLADYEDRRLDR